MIKVVLFDVGGTLLHANPSVGGVYARVAARHGVDASGEILDERFKDAWGRHRQLGQAIEKAWWRKLVEDVFQGHAVPDGDAFFEDLYESFRDPASWFVYPDVRPTLEALRQRGLRLAVASNWDERLPGLLESIGLLTWFERRFISFDLGFSKPDRRFFQAALDGMGVDAGETVHVGNDPEEDIRGAEAAGIRAYLIDRKARPLNSRMISTLTEILVRV